SFNRQRDYWATKSYLLKYIGKPGAGQHHIGYDKGQIEVHEVILRHARGEFISIQDWRKLRRAKQRKRLQYIHLETQRKRYRQDDRSNSGGNNLNFQTRQNNRDDFRSQGLGQRGGRGDYRGRGYRGNRGSHNRDNRAADTYYNGYNHNLFSVAPCPPAQIVLATSSNTVVPNLSQRQIGVPTPQLVRTPNSWMSNMTPIPKQQPKQPTLPQSTPSQPQPTNQQQITMHPQPYVYYLSTQSPISTSQSSETTNSNIIPIQTPGAHKVQQKQDRFLLPCAAVYPLPINPTNIELPPTVDTQQNDMIQFVNNMLAPQQQAQNQQQLVNQQQQLFSLWNQQINNQPFRLPDHPHSWSSISTQPMDIDFRAEQDAQRLHNQMLLQENRARREYQIHMQQKSQNKAQKFLMDEMLLNLEARSKGYNNPSKHPFGNFQSSFYPNQYINDLSQIPSQDQQEFFNDSNYNRIQREDDHNSNDNVFGESVLIQLQLGGHRGKGKKERSRCKAQPQAQPLLTSHQLIQESSWSKLKVPEQRRKKTGAANGTINPSAQSSHIKQIAGGSDNNFGSSMDIDMEQMMEKDLTQIQPTTNDD
ncbi:MAG: hypothetical protein EZS28_040810, partial [Streblomastix strix]